MKLKTILTLIIMALFSTSANCQRTWQQKYGIDPSNTCPVFTRPDRTGSDRTHGAGIHTNDGAAYNCTYYSLGEEWHYAPKLHLCDEEKQVMPRVTGEIKPREILKFGVNPLKQGGAMVTYRIFDYDDEAANHVIATYDVKGNLLDAICFGTRLSFNDVLQAEPHGAYQTMVNMGGNNWQVGDDMTITLTRYHFFRPNSQNESDKWEDTLVYRLDPQGHFRLIGHNQRGKPAVNPQAEKLMQLTMLPLSATDVIPQWNELARQTANNPALARKVQDGVMRLMVSRTQEFLAWTANNRKQSVLIGVLRRALTADENPYPKVEYIINALEACPDPKVAAYWKSIKLTE